MYKISLSRGRIVQVSDEEFNILHKSIQDKDPEIKIGNFFVRPREISGYEHAGNDLKKDYNLSNPSDKAVILEFEKMFEQLVRDNPEPDRDLEYYGRIHDLWRESRERGEGINSFVPPIRTGWVFSPTFLGLAHWSWVRYCIKNDIICRTKRSMKTMENNTSDWAVVSLGIEPAHNFEPYESFNKKWRGYHELLDRRIWAKEMDGHEVSSLIKSASLTWRTAF